MSNATVPGQNAPSTNYTQDITQIAQMLLEFNQTSGSKVVFMATTPYLCSTTSNGCVQTLNNEAIAVMDELGIPVISSYNAIVEQCGGVPVQSCFGETGCFCPHCMRACSRNMSHQVLLISLALIVPCRPSRLQLGGRQCHRAGRARAVGLSNHTRLVLIGWLVLRHSLHSTPDLRMASGAHSRDWRMHPLNTCACGPRPTSHRVDILA
jgi:hypothetical protein